MERRQTVWTGLTAAGIVITVISLSSPSLFGESGGINYYPASAAASTPYSAPVPQTAQNQAVSAQSAGASSAGSFARVPSGTLLRKNPAPSQPIVSQAAANQASVSQVSINQPAVSQPVQNQSAVLMPQESAAAASSSYSAYQSADNETSPIPETPFVSAYAGGTASAPAPAVFTAQNPQTDSTPQPAVQPSAQSAQPAVQSAPQGTASTQPVQPAQASQTSPAAANAAAPSSGILTENANASSAAPANGILPPPEGFSMTAEDEKLLDQFLLRWEEFGRHIKRVACEVQIKEHDGGLFMQNTKGGKIPLSHTWGKFKFIAPNRLSYHVEGEYAYQPGASSDDEPKMEFKKGSGELKYVCDGKSWAEYDFKNRVVHIYSIPEDQWNQDLSMDGPIPLFFIANAKNLKNRFYLNIVTPKSRTSSEVWIEAYPRLAADSGSFQRIIIILSLTDLQPTYMRKYYINGKSYSELWFQNVTINKGMWDIEADVDFGWEKKVMDETFAITPIEPALPNSGVKATSGTLPPEEQK